MSEQKLAVLLVIPLYNHGATVVEVVDRSLATGLDVLVVDDGSSDRGLDRLAGYQISRIQFRENKGKGTAILAAFTFAADNGYDAVLTIDADGQHNPLEAPLLVDEAEAGCWPAIIIGSRRMVQETVPGSSRFGRNFSNFWVRLECGRDLSDTQSGMRLYPVKQMCGLKLTRSRYDFEIEVLVKAVWGGVDVRSVDVSVHYPPAAERVSHFHKFIDNVRLSLLHTGLISRRLLPLPHHKVVDGPPREERVFVQGNPLKTLKNLCLESSSPFWLAVAVWFGIFLGALPLIACHTVVIIYVTYRFRLNKVAAVAASQFCMPPVVPALCIEAGYFILHGSFLLDLSWDRWVLEIHYRLWEWFVGSLLVGPVLGLLGALPVYWFARNMRTRAERRISSGSANVVEDEGEYRC
ncbi:DUF2062 domain-containing protein [Desulfopila sp. IMCC35008]|uniref:DUF2062 domain-containing protein n=1 Tax=Desulfopila sp. IMCC35008 TaxID=2653858 RepID=UPI0013D0BEC8|nr:DUF2062 domain-containing protein [Desulfopila sp. IMCC35008]